jgi:hypothetical protein
VVITQSLPLLLRGLDDPPIRDIPSKRELLGRIKHLYLEPADLLDPAAGPTDADDAKIRDDWAVVVSASNDTPVFPNLHTLSVGAFSGSAQFAEQTQRWTGVEWNFIHETRDLITHFLSDHPQLRHMCDWGVGPIVVSGAVPKRIKDDSCCSASIAIHGFGHDVDPEVYASYGPIRRYIHTRSKNELTGRTYPGADYDEIRRLVGFALTDRRAMVHDQDDSDKSVPCWDLDENIYITLPPDGGDTDISTEGARAVWRKEAESVQESLRVMLADDAEHLAPDWYNPRDSWTVSQLFDAPRCEACGWEPVETEV